MKSDLKTILKETPKQEVLFSINPQAAKKFKILPIKITKPEGSKEERLHVVGLEGIKEIQQPVDWQLFKKVINYFGKVDKEIWEEAYNRFYKDFL